MCITVYADLVVLHFSSVFCLQGALAEQGRLLVQVSGLSGLNRNPLYLDGCVICFVCVFRMRSRCGTGQGLPAAPSSPEGRAGTSSSLRRWSSSARRLRLLCRRKPTSPTTTFTRGIWRYVCMCVCVHVRMYMGVCPLCDMVRYVCMCVCLL